RTRPSSFAFRSAHEAINPPGRGRRDDGRSGSSTSIEESGVVDDAKSTPRDSERPAAAWRPVVGPRESPRVFTTPTGTPLPSFPMSRPRRLRRWWPVIPVVLVAMLVYAAWPGRSTFTVSPETTYVTGPLDENGYVDYQTALNERLAKDVTPENNANVLIWQALGPHPEGPTMPPHYFKWLGRASPPEDGVYFIDRDKYFEKHLKDLPEEMLDAPPDEFEPEPDRRRQWSERVDRAGKWPWKAKDEPDIDAWLKRNEKPLAVAIEASKRTRYFNPLVSRSTDTQSARIIDCLLPNVQKCREVGH